MPKFTEMLVYIYSGDSKLELIFQMSDAANGPLVRYFVEFNYMVQRQTQVVIFHNNKMNIYTR